MNDQEKDSAITSPVSGNALNFLSEVSHDFKAPVNRIHAYVNMALRESAANEKLQGYLEEALLASLELLDLSTDMLDWSFLKSGTLTYQAEIFELAPFMKSCADAVHEDLKKKPIKLDLKLPESLPSLFQDKNKLRRIVVNLMINAYKYTDKGTITVQVSVEGELIRIMVADTGCGISAEHLAKVFTPFMRVSEERMTGTGLGLAVAQKFAQSLGGEIHASSTLGKGSQFTVSIPSELDVLDAAPDSSNIA